MRALRIVATASEKNHCASAEFYDGDGIACINLDGSTFQMQPETLELLYHALHEIFGERPVSGGRAKTWSMT